MTEFLAVGRITEISSNAEDCHILYHCWLCHGVAYSIRVCDSDILSSPEQ